MLEKFLAKIYKICETIKELTLFFELYDSIEHLWMIKTCSI